MSINNFNVLFCSSVTDKALISAHDNPIHTYVVDNVSLPLAQPCFEPGSQLESGSKTSQD